MRSFVLLCWLLIATVNADTYDCDPNPCVNEAACVDLVDDDYSCLCLTGFTGKNCSVDIDDCDPDPCFNGGSCLDMIDHYFCSCPPGYTGNNCLVDIDDCDPYPCVNGNICVDLVNDYNCICLPDIDDCDPNPCMNGGTCTDLVGDYLCVCPSGYTAKNCEVAIDYCDPNPCVNGGTCIDIGFDYLCICPLGYTGRNCSEESNCTCSVHGDPHFITFDGQKINYQGICVFLFAELEKDDCSVSVFFKTVRRNVHTKAAYVEEIHVVVGGSGDVIGIGQNKEITVNDVPLIPIYQWTDYVITEVDDFIVVTSTCGMTAMFDGKKTAKVIISEEDGDKTNGICGICNGLPDDLKTADGTDVSNEKDKFKKIGNSYARPPLDSCDLPVTSD